MSIPLQIPSPLEQLKSPLLEKHEIEIWIKRDDLIHQKISGNKWRKLELNIKEAKRKKLPLLTFGGPFSNHIAATAFACSSSDIKSIGIIRGDEFSELNHTLDLANKNGMQLHFVTREEYQLKSEPAFLQSLKQKFGDFHFVPEGGANKEGVRGSRNIRKEVQVDFDLLCCTAGTGTTAAGILSALNTNEQLEVYPALKGGGYLEIEILKMLQLEDSPKLLEQKKSQLELINDYHFGGFAKLKPMKELVDFVNWFYKEFGISLDLIYNGKMMFGVFDRIKKGRYKKGTNLVAIHCGGLQGNEGMEKRFGFKLEY